MTINRVIFLILPILQFFIIQNIYAQNIDWVLHTNASTSEVITDKTIDSAGNIYAIGIFDRNLSFNNDTNRITNNFFSSFITKVDANGRMIWIKDFINCRFDEIVFANNSLVVYGSTRDTFATNAGTIIGTNSNIRGFLINFNLNGQINLLKNLGVVNNFTVLKLKSDFVNNIYVTGNISNNVVIDGININRNVGSLSDGILLKFSLNLNLNSFIKFSNTSIVDVAFDISGNQYITGNLSGSSNIGSYFLTNAKNDIFYAKINQINQVIWAYKISGAENEQSSSIALFKNKIYISGHGFNLINFNGKNYNMPTANQYNGFITTIDTSGQVLMVRFFDSPNSFINEVTINPLNEILLIGRYNNSLKFDNKQISWPIQNCLFAAKLDEYLNCLWLLSLNSTGSIAGVLSNNFREYFFSGSVYSNFILFGDYYSPVFQHSNNGFLAKISDISITKGMLTKREFCGGDSIFMPYQKTGRFKFGNRFSLQLSNPQGRFDTLVQTIGFRSDTLNGTIQALLPLNLQASNLYRFRVVSDSPAVTSFYDTTTYTFFPAPLAKTITDSAICNAQQVVAGLNTSNALQYLWQPAFMVSDSTTKQPLLNTILPEGIYKVKLLAKNGFCTATDSFIVNLKPPLITKTPNLLKHCKNDSITINPNIQGGLTHAYKTAWHFGSISNPIIDSNEVFRCIADSSFMLYVNVSDGCSLPTTDSVLVNVSQYFPLVIKDTFSCFGNSLQWQINADTLFNRFVWFDLAYNVLTDTNETLQILNADSSNTFIVLNKHLCNNNTDTFIVKHSVLPPLKLQLTADSILCKNQPVKIPVTASGGIAVQYRLFLNNLLLDSATAFTYDSAHKAFSYIYNYNPQHDRVLVFSLNDGCSKFTFSDSVKIKTFLPVTIAAYQPELVCNDAPVILKPNITGGKTPLNFTWALQSNLDSILSSADTLFIAKAATANYKLLVLDGCNKTDSLYIPIQPNVSPNALFFMPTNNICKLQQVKPENTSSISAPQELTYKWFWQNKSSNLFEPNIYFNDTGTFNITLVVTSQQGCSDTFTMQQAMQVHPTPTANFYANKQSASIQEAVFEFTNTSVMQGQGKWQWDFGNATFAHIKNPTVQYLQSGLYSIKLIATNAWHCSDTLLKTNYIYVEPGLTVYLPNAISVNNDGLNDNFLPVGADIEAWEMQIFNRWGAMVYSGNNLTVPFNGRDKNGIFLPTDSYIYNIKVIFKYNISKTITGNLTLIK